MTREEQDRLAPRERLLAVIKEWGDDKTSTTRMERTVGEVLAEVRAEALEAEARALRVRADDDRRFSTGPGSAWAVRAAFLDGEAVLLDHRAAEIRGGR